MAKYTKINLMQMVLVIFLLAVGPQCPCAPSDGARHIPAPAVPDLIKKANAIATIQQPSFSVSPSDLVVIYVPYADFRYYGVGPHNLRDALHEFLATGDCHPHRLGSHNGVGTYAAIIRPASQKEAVLGLLDTQRTPARSPDYESEILFTEQSWDKMVIIDHDGIVLDVIEKRGILVEKSPPSKLTPLAFQKIKDLLGKVFPQSMNDTPSNY